MLFFNLGRFLFQFLAFNIQLIPAFSILIPTQDLNIVLFLSTLHIFAHLPLNLVQLLTLFLQLFSQYDYFFLHFFLDGCSLFFEFFFEFLFIGILLLQLFDLFFGVFKLFQLFISLFGELRTLFFFLLKQFIGVFAFSLSEYSSLVFGVIDLLFQFSDAFVFDTQLLLKACILLFGSFELLFE